MKRRSNERIRREETNKTKNALFTDSKILDSMQPMKNMQIFPNPIDSIKGMYDKTISSFSKMLEGVGPFPKMRPMSPMNFLGAMSPQSMLPAGLSTGMMPPGMSPGMMPPGMSPEMMPPGMSPGMLPPGMLPTGMLPPGINSPGALPPGISEEDLQKILSGMKNRKRSVEEQKVNK